MSSELPGPGRVSLGVDGAVSSAGQSACLTSRRSPVRSRDRPLAEAGLTAVPKRHRDSRWRSRLSPGYGNKVPDGPRRADSLPLRYERAAQGPAHEEGRRMVAKAARQWRTASAALAAFIAVLALPAL